MYQKPHPIHEVDASMEVTLVVTGQTCRSVHIGAIGIST